MRRSASPRVLLVTPTPEQAALAELLAAEGWDIHVVVEQRDESFAEMTGALPARALHAPRSSGGRPSSLDTALAVARGAMSQPRAIRREARSASRRVRASRSWALALSPKLLHFSSLSVTDAWKGVSAALRAVVVASISGEEAIARGYEEGAWPANVNAVHLESEEIAAQLDGTLPPATRMAVIPPSPDPELFGCSHSPDAELVHSRPGRTGRKDPLRVLSVGPLSWTQGYEHALAAIRLLLDRGLRCEYRILGKGPFRDAVSFARHELGLEPAVRLLEPASRAQLRRQLRWADVFLDASVAPTSPKPLLDAGACGLPLITTAPLEEQHGAIPILRRDPGSACDALHALLDSQSLRERLAFCGRRHARAALDSRAQAALIAQLYRSLSSEQYAARA